MANDALRQSAARYMMAIFPRGKPFGYLRDAPTRGAYGYEIYDYETKYAD